MPADAPARFVRRQAWGGFDLLADFRIGWLQAVGCPQHDLCAGTARQANAEENLEDLGHLDMGQTKGLVQHDHGGLGVGADLSSGSAEGVGGL